VPVLIEGETGTGKELAARRIHYKGARQKKPFVPINCGAIPDSLIENELFGHRRGAYTDARADVPGLLKLADGGTLLLDEVDMLPQKGQVTLLRFLQNQTFRKLGGQHDERVDVRIIAASNRSLERLAAQNEFRSDLLFRIKLMFVELPALRDRSGDARLLADHFLKECAVRYGVPARRLDAATLDWLDRYQWPGNVRELENLIHRSFLLSDRAEIAIDRPVAAAARAGDQHIQIEDCANYRAAKARAIASFDVGYLRTLLAQNAGNIARAARAAGKERRALGKLLKRYGIDAMQFRNQ
jgi:DNA-binding NtrC family response regulator